MIIKKNDREGENNLLVITISSYMSVTILVLFTPHNFNLGWYEKRQEVIIYHR